MPPPHNFTRESQQKMQDAFCGRCIGYNQSDAPPYLLDEHWPFAPNCWRYASAVAADGPKRVNGNSRNRSTVGRQIHSFPHDVLRG